MAQVLSLYNKWLLKNQNFRQKFTILGDKQYKIRLKPSKWNGIYAAVSLGPILPLHNVSESYA